MAGDLWFWSVQHSVGQGLMHSGVLADGDQLKKSGENLLSVVYDCGTLTGKRKKLIRREVDLLASRIDSLDALYISHFDDDHVNGLPELFDRFTPSLIAIPHVTAAERFFRVVHARGGYGLSTLGQVTRGMLLNPKRTISDIVGRVPIVEIGPGQTAPSAQRNSRAMTTQGMALAQSNRVKIRVESAISLTRGGAPYGLSSRG